MGSGGMNSVGIGKILGEIVWGRCRMSTEGGGGVEWFKYSG